MHAAANAAVSRSPSPSASGPNAVSTAGSRRGDDIVWVAVCEWVWAHASQASTHTQTAGRKRSFFFRLWRLAHIFFQRAPFFARACSAPPHAPCCACCVLRASQATGRGPPARPHKTHGPPPPLMPPSPLRRRRTSARLAAAAAGATDSEVVSVCVVEEKKGGGGRAFFFQRAGRRATDLTLYPTLTRNPTPSRPLRCVCIKGSMVE